MQIELDAESVAFTTKNKDDIIDFIAEVDCALASNDFSLKLMQTLLDEYRCSLTNAEYLEFLSELGLTIKDNPVQ